VQLWVAIRWKHQFIFYGIVLLLQIVGIISSLRGQGNYLALKLLRTSSRSWLFLSSCRCLFWHHGVLDCQEQQKFKTIYLQELVLVGHKIKHKYAKINQRLASWTILIYSVFLKPSCNYPCTFYDVLLWAAMGISPTVLPQSKICKLTRIGNRELSCLRPQTWLVVVPQL
jgi:hypothetical protein